ncbi:MAG: AgmX/PglI C-terminal domain-containing protein [Sandaracinaceae bacterium]|nr:AgmX/PglI C-terminal domain-containing protein [Sandaracinaceae bacterium]
MSAHQPKWNALHALDQGQLSAEGERRLRAHLAGCPECTRAFAAMSLYAGAKAEVQQQRVGLAPDAWERLSRAIERDAAQVPADEPAEEEDLASAYERISTEVRLTPAPPIAANMADRVLELRAREHQDRAWSWAATLAAAACFALATQLFGAGHVGHGGSRAPEVATHHAVPPETEASAPVVEAPALDIHVRAMSGTPRTDETPLRLGTRVQEGQRCETGEHDSAHFSVGENSGFALSAEGVAVVTRARLDGVLLTLERGALSSSVASGTPYSVLAPPYAFEVRGTRFSVARRTDGAVSARVAEGSVAVMRGGEVLALLGPGDEWSSAGAGFAPEPHVWSPRAGVTLHVPAPERSPFVSFEADSVIWDAHSDVVLTVREGASLRLTFFDARGRATSVDTRPVAEGSTIEAPVPSRLVRGHLPASVLSSVVRAHRGDLDFCVSRAVRMAARELGEVTLRLTITPEGVVSDVQLSGPGASQPLRACLSAKARTWAFPRPGGSLPVQTQMRLAISPH